MTRSIDCERCGEPIETGGTLAKCDNCGWYKWWPFGEPPPDKHPGW